VEHMHAECFFDLGFGGELLETYVASGLFDARASPL
jgi:hypothetical protein